MNKITRFLITWDGLWSIPVASIALFIVSGLLLDLNPNADVIGLGLVQDVFTAAFRTVIGSSVAQIGIAVNVFLFFGFGIKEFKLLWSLQKSWVKMFVVFGLYACYLLAFVLALP